MTDPLPDPFSSVLGIGEELRTGTDYFWDNHRRGSGEEAVIQLTLAGAGFLEDARGRSFAPAGTAMLFSHDEDSRYGYPPEATASYRLRYLVFKVAGLRAWFDRLRAEFGAVVLMAPAGEAADIFADLVRRYKKRQFRDRVQETELLHRLLVALYREQVAATQTRDPVDYGSHHLRDNFRSPLNLKEVAALCGVSREHFIRAFRRRHGEPPGALLRRLRLEHAHRMLRATQLPVQEVALASGFADANTFCRAYRLKFGVSPGAARKQGRFTSPTVGPDRDDAKKTPRPARGESGSGRRPL
ncbi:MAG: AraC family transcriptional regulator [Opitutaceae bacterium]|jgi:AraC-like DNA-binding protein|nr:AraC family transcriptional regulator [Opitutaceae bacterium]